jgi:hypothetical protein
VLSGSAARSAARDPPDSYAEAIGLYERAAKARNAAPAHPIFRTLLASAYALKGDTERAGAELAEARRLVGDDRYSSIARLRSVVSWGAPKVLVETTCIAGLRKAGVPER